MAKPVALWLVVGVVIGLVIGAGASHAILAGAKGTGGVAAAGTPTPTSTAAAPTGGSTLPSEIPIGAILPLTGDLSGYGEKWKYALQLAEEDINAYVQELGLNVRFEITDYIEDTKTSEEGAIAAMQTLAAKGVKVVLGPGASASVAAVQNYVNSNKIVIISPSSTAISLALPGDYVFRTVTTDAFQAKAIAKMLWSRGVRKAAVIYRNDDWGVGLFNNFKDEFEGLGGRVDGVPYDPKAEDLSSEVRTLSDKVSALGVGADTAVLLISFEEDGIKILMAAENDPVLTQVKWFGCDGTACSTKILEAIGDAVATKFSGLPSTLFAPTESPKREEFVEKFKARFHMEPDAYSHNIYDAAWIAALTIIEVGRYDGEAIKEALPEVAARYFGVSGWVVLNENGDRAFGDYTIFAIAIEDGKPTWRPVGAYVSSTDEIQWFIKT